MRTTAVLPTLVLLASAVVSTAADESPGANRAPAAEGLTGTDSRYEGLPFLDVAGKPLPIQTDTEIEAFLAEAPIVQTEAVPTGITLPRKLTLRGEGFEAHAVFKDVDVSRSKHTEIINGRNHFSFEWIDHYRYDVAAYEFDRILGLDRVPPTVSRTIRGDSGAISIWVSQTVSEFERERNLKIEPPNPTRWNQQRMLMQVFDNLVANRDRNLGNILIDTNWRIWFIDCTRCFGTKKTLYYPLEDITHCERGIWQALNAMDDAETRARLAPYLNKSELKALFARRDAVVRHFQKLIREGGEAAVLYDIEPPSETAPWGGS
jgi:hypothetical protein